MLNLTRIRVAGWRFALTLAWGTGCAGAIDDPFADAVRSGVEYPQVGGLQLRRRWLVLRGPRLARCGMTAVATLQWSDTEAKHTFPWFELSEHYQHDGGFKPAE